MTTLRLVVLAIALFQEPDPERSLSGLDAQAFRRAFEAAFAAEDAGHIEELVAQNPTRFVALFADYAQVWIDLRGEPGSRELAALARARGLAEAVDSTLEAPGLLEEIAVLEALDDEQRARMKGALVSIATGTEAKNRFDWQEAVDACSSAATTLSPLGELLWLARSLNSLGAFYHALGQHEKAIDHQQRALALKETIGDPKDIARSLHNLGTYYDSLCQYEKAIDHLQRALALGDKIGDLQIIAGSLNNLGSCYSSFGQYEKAVNHLQRALVLFEKIGNPEDIARPLTGLGNCYFLLGQYEKAIDQHRRALALQERIGNPEAIAISLTNLGSCYTSLGQYEKAIDHQQRALAMKEELGKPQDIAISLTNLGVYYELLGQYEKAIDHYQCALALRERISNPREIDSPLNNLGSCYFSLGQYEKAIDHYQRALALREKTGKPQDIATSLNNLGCCYSLLGQHETSLESFERCVASLQRVPRRTQSEEGRAAFLTQWISLPHSVTSLAFAARGNASLRALERGFPLLESFLGRTALESLQEKAEGVLAAADPTLARAREVVLNRLVELRLGLARAVENKDDARATSLRDAIPAAEKDLEVLDETLRAKNPKLKEIVAPDVATLEQVQTTVLDPETAILLYVLGEERSFVWVVTKDQATIVPLAGETTLKAAYDRLDLALTGGADGDAFVEPARMLYQELLAPVAVHVAEKPNLVIVPDGFLGFLPFEVLLTRDLTANERSNLSGLPYLLRTKIVRYAPSASLLYWFAKHGKHRAGSWPKDLLLVGDALHASEHEIPDALAQRAARALVPERFERLKHTRAEVLALAQERIDESEAKLFLELRDLERSGKVSGKHFDLVVGDQASKAALAHDLSAYRIVHLAVHGYFDPEYPWFSGLVLSPGQEASQGFLNTMDIASLELDAQIVFLSACETAKGKLLRVDGIRNTARAFMLAGAQTVVATQWSVQDDAAAVVAQAFYDRLFAGVEPARALADAKVALADAKVALIDQKAGNRGARALDRARDSSRYAHPSFWAAFVVWGG